MRFVVWMSLVTLAIAAVVSGQLAIALALAGVKALLVGFQYMELRWAHRAHAASFAGAVIGLMVLLEFITRAAQSR